jgi:uncharacterized damage-inducible protein DinB
MTTVMEAVKTETTIHEPSKTPSPTMEPMLQEFRDEAAITRRVLDRVPADKLSWTPHPRSMTLGQLAMHLASIPGSLSKLAQLDEFDVAQAKFVPAQPSDLQEIQSTLDEGVRYADEYLAGMSEREATGTWRLLLNGREISRQPRVGMIRTIMFNHWYHHRGQLSVYLRLLNVPVPVIYGPSADESPFA